MRLRICVVTFCLGLLTALPLHGLKGVRAILSVAHVTRNSGKIRETRIYVMRDHQYFLEVVDQRQRSRDPECQQFRGVLPDKNFKQSTVLKESPEWHSLRNSSSDMGYPDGEFWFIAIPRETGTQFQVFNIKGKAMPEVVQRLITWFEQTEKPRPLESMSENQCSVFSERTANNWRR
jgi:hypothetical protein